MQVMHKISVALIAAIYSLFGGIAHAITIDSLDSSSTNAAPAGDVIISPLRWVETVSPGDRITRAFQIGNRTSNPMIFELSTEDMVGTRDLEDPTSPNANNCARLAHSRGARIPR